MTARPQIGVTLGAYPDEPVTAEWWWRFAERAEALGFDSLWAGEHVLFHIPTVAAPILLAAFAARTRRIRIGPRSRGYRARPAPVHRCRQRAGDRQAERGSLAHTHLQSAVRRPRRPVLRGRHARGVRGGDRAVSRRRCSSFRLQLGMPAGRDPRAARARRNRGHPMPRQHSPLVAFEAGGEPDPGEPHTISHGLLLTLGAQAARQGRSRCGWGSHRAPRRPASESPVRPARWETSACAGARAGTSAIR